MSEKESVVSAEATQDHYSLYKNKYSLQLMHEVRQILGLCCPIAAINLVGYLKSAISVASLGRLGQLELAGGALAVGFVNITGYSVLSGLAMGMEPICSQAIGCGNTHLAALTFKRTILMLLCFSMLIAIMWLKLETILLSLQQNPEVSHVAASYCTFSIPDLLSSSLLYPLRIYLRNSNTVKPLMWITVIGSVLHGPLTFLLAFTFNMGVSGIAAASCCTNFITLSLLLWYMFNTKLYCGPLSVKLTDSRVEETTPSWLTLIHLALPSCIGVCLEWWWYEFMTLVAGYLANPQLTLSMSAIVIQTTSLMYTLPASFSASISTRVGNELGAGNPWKAKLSAIAAMLMSSSSSSLGLMFTIVCRGPWASLFSSDQETLGLARSVLPIIGLSELANCLQTTGCGILRGSARPSIAAAINFYSFYLVGAPVALFLAFSNGLGFVGLCYGLLAAQVTCAFSVLSTIYTTDWNEESTKAKHLTGKHPSLGRTHSPTIYDEETSFQGCLKT